MKKVNLIIIIIASLMAVMAPAAAQEIKAKVTVNTEQLTTESRNYVASMASDIERYINNQQFTETEWKGEKIPVDIMIYLSGGNGTYSARFYFASYRVLDAPKDVTPPQSIALRMIDNNWSFPYGFGASLTYNPLRFDELTSLIDFYMLLVIGCDLDSYSELGGSRVFGEAKNIVQMGASIGATGWKLFSEPGDITKYNVITELNDFRYEDLRRIILDYYLDGLDEMAFNADSAKLSLESTISHLADYKHDKMTGPSVFLQVFFDSKSQEIASIFNGWPNETLYRNLKYLDPGHSLLYDDSRDGKVK